MFSRALSRVRRFAMNCRTVSTMLRLLRVLSLSLAVSHYSRIGEARTCSSTEVQSFVKAPISCAGAREKRRAFQDCEGPTELERHDTDLQLRINEAIFCNKVQPSNDYKR